MVMQVRVLHRKPVLEVQKDGVSLAENQRRGSEQPVVQVGHDRCAAYLSVGQLDPEVDVESTIHAADLRWVDEERSATTTAIPAARRQQESQG